MKSYSIAPTTGLVTLRGYHYTTVTVAERIERAGFIDDPNKGGKYWGHGIYACLPHAKNVRATYMNYAPGRASCHYQHEDKRVAELYVEAMVPVDETVFIEYAETRGRGKYDAIEAAAAVYVSAAEGRAHKYEYMESGQWRALPRCVKLVSWREVPQQEVRAERRRLEAMGAY